MYNAKPSFAFLCRGQDNDTTIYTEKEKKNILGNTCKDLKQMFCIAARFCLI